MLRDLDLDAQRTAGEPFGPSALDERQRRKLDRVLVGTAATVGAITAVETTGLSTAVLTDAARAGDTSVELLAEVVTDLCVTPGSASAVSAVDNEVAGLDTAAEPAVTRE